MKIETVDDVKIAGHRIIEKLVQNKLTYFAVTIFDASGFSPCYFTPVTTTQDQNRQKIIMVQDYEKIMMLLLSHPNVIEVEYHEDENMVSAIFSNPMGEEYERSEYDDPDWPM